MKTTHAEILSLLATTLAPAQCAVIDAAVADPRTAQGSMYPVAKALRSLGLTTREGRPVDDSIAARAVAIAARLLVADVPLHPDDARALDGLRTLVAAARGGW